MWNTSRESLCNSDYKLKNCGQKGYYRAFPNSQKLERKAVTCSLHACQTESNKQHKKLMFHEVIIYTSTWKILFKHLENSKLFFKNSIWWAVEASRVIAGKAEFKNYLLIIAEKLWSKVTYAGDRHHTHLSRKLPKILKTCSHLKETLHLSLWQLDFHPQCWNHNHLIMHINAVKHIQNITIINFKSLFSLWEDSKFVPYSKLIYPVLDIWN